MIDRFTDKLYWPALIAAWLGLSVAATATFVGLPFSEFVRPTLIGIGSLATFTFLVMLFDGATRRAVTAINLYFRDHRAQLNAARKSMNWRQRLIGPDPRWPDAHLQRVCTVGIIVMLAVGFEGQRDSSLLAFGSVFLGGVTSIMRLKRAGWGDQANVR